jgi:biopolymer transport protein ExbB
LARAGLAVNFGGRINLPAMAESKPAPAPKIRVRTGRLSTLLAALVIPVALVAAWLIYSKILGNPANFVEGDPSNEPLKENYLGLVYKGGALVILLISFMVILFTYIVERFLTIMRSRGRGGNAAFVSEIKGMVNQFDHPAAITACDRQRGSVANVIRNGLVAFERLEGDPAKSEDEKLLLLQNDLEEATQLELPHLTNNLVVIGTLAQISTLIGLLGTVTGMIKAFAALARVGSPDAIGLANGISQALVTTALGITTAAIAIVFYNFFSARIEKITNAIDEASYSILHSFKTRQLARAKKA